MSVTIALWVHTLVPWHLQALLPVPAARLDGFQTTVVPGCASSAQQARFQARSVLRAWQYARIAVQGRVVGLWGLAKVLSVWQEGSRNFLEQLLVWSAAKAAFQLSLAPMHHQCARCALPANFQAVRLFALAALP